MSIIDHSATELLALLTKKELSASEIAKAYVGQIKYRDDQIGSFIEFDSEAVFAQLEQGSFDQGLQGLPIAIKDVICVKNSRTSCGSKMLRNFESPYDATIIEKLRVANGVLLGRTNMDEFAMGSSNENSAIQPTRNPWNRDHVPGGSSGGAAACIAARMAPLSLGTDTGGSVRQPAAFCGVTGLKPTYGRISRFGLVAFASSLDQIGTLTQDAADAALLLAYCSGHDPRDSTSSPVPADDYRAALGTSIKGIKIGIPREYVDESVAKGMDEDVRSALDKARLEFEKLGAEFIDISLPMTTYGVATYYLVASCEASGNLARYDGAHYGFRADPEAVKDATEDELLRMYRQTRSEGFGTEVKRRIMLGTYALSSGYYDAYYLKALKTRRLIQEELNKAFETVDLILGPTTPTPAFRIGEKTSNPLEMYLGDIFTVIANLAGIPAISFPAGLSRNQLPIGLQLQGPAFSEARLLQTTDAFQQVTYWHQLKPPLTDESVSGDTSEDRS